MPKDRWFFAERIVPAFCRPHSGVFFVLYPDPIKIVFFEAPVIVKSSYKLFGVMRFVHESLKTLSHPTANQVAQLLRLPTLVVEMLLGKMRQLGLVDSDPAGRWQAVARWPTGTDTLRYPRKSRKLVCYWPEHDLLLPAEPRVRLRDLVGLEIHQLRDELQEIYKKLVTQSKEAPFLLANGDEIQFLPEDQPVADPQDLALRSTPSEELDPPTLLSSACQSDWFSNEASPVLASRSLLDLLVVVWTSYKNGLWRIHWRIWSRPLTSLHQRSQASFSPGAVSEGLPVLEILAGQSLQPLGAFFDTATSRWKSLISCPLGEPAKRLRRTLSPQAKAVLQLESPSENREYVLIPVNLSPHLRLVAGTLADHTTQS